MFFCKVLGLFSSLFYCILHSHCIIQSKLIIIIIIIRMSVLIQRIVHTLNIQMLTIMMIIDRLWSQPRIFAGISHSVWSLCSRLRWSVVKSSINPNFCLIKSINVFSMRLPLMNKNGSTKLLLYKICYLIKITFKSVERFLFCFQWLNCINLIKLVNSLLEQKFFLIRSRMHWIG